MSAPVFVVIAPPGIKAFSSIQMQTPNPPLGAAYIAGALKAAGLRCKVIDAVGEGITQIGAYKTRPDMKVQGLTEEQILERIPAARWGQPQDLAGAALFLSSPASDYVTGTVLTVDGGWMAR